MMSQRIEWIDIAKGGGMILVILEHSVFYGGLVSNVIMAVAMPLFFVLSGVVFNKNSKNVIAKRTKKLIVPYLVFCILNTKQYLSNTYTLKTKCSRHLSFRGLLNKNPALQT